MKDMEREIKLHNWCIQMKKQNVKSGALKVYVNKSKQIGENIDKKI
jgi:hypothetical protein